MTRRFCVGCLLLLAVGCGTDGPPRAIVQGMVSYAGQPIQVGTIRFLIDDRPSALGRIEKGHYRIDVNGGVPVGTGRVEIEGFEETDKVIFVGVGGKTQREARPIVPAKYNRQSTLTTTITAGKVNEVNFELTP